MRLVLPYITRLKNTLLAVACLAVYTVFNWHVLNPEFLWNNGNSVLLILGIWALGAVLVPLALIVDITRRNAKLKLALNRHRQLALRDDLTGVNNRRHLMDYLQRQKALVDRSGGTFSICFADLDHFKRMNDRYGHVAGDQVLKGFANLAVETVRDVDFVARIGGEEFVLVLTGASAREAFPVAERVRLGMERMIVYPDDPTYRVTVSLGIAQYCKEEGVDDLLHRADTALYQAKKNRNQVQLAPLIRIVDMPQAATPEVIFKN